MQRSADPGHEASHPPELALTSSYSALPDGRIDHPFTALTSNGEYLVV